MYKINFKNFLFIFCFIPLLCIACSNKDYILNGSIEGVGDVKIILQTYHGSSLTSIDSVFSKNGKFKFVLPDNLEKGMLKVKIGANPPI